MQSTNKYLNTLIEANSTTYEDIVESLGFKHGQLISRYKPATQLKYKYKMIIKLVDKGYTVPYHHRPKCRKCGVFYIPHKQRQYDCSECSNLEDWSFTLSDLLELEYTPEEAVKQLGLPARTELFSLLKEWDEDKEEEFLGRLVQVLGE